MSASDKQDEGKEKPKIKIRDLKPRKNPKGGYDDSSGGSSPPPGGGGSNDPYSYP